MLRLLQLLKTLKFKVVKIFYKIFLRKVDFSLFFDFVYNTIFINWIISYCVMNYMFKNFENIFLFYFYRSGARNYSLFFYKLIYYLIKFISLKYVRYTLATLMIWSIIVPLKLFGF